MLAGLAGASAVLGGKFWRDALQSIVPGVMLPFWDEADDYSLHHGVPAIFNQPTVDLPSYGLMGIPNPLRSFTLPISVSDSYWGDQNADAHEAHPYYKRAGHTTVRYPLSGLVGDFGDSELTYAHNQRYPDQNTNDALLDNNIMAWLNGPDRQGHRSRPVPGVVPADGARDRRGRRRQDQGILPGLPRCLEPLQREQLRELPHSPRGHRPLLPEEHAGGRGGSRDLHREGSPSRVGAPCRLEGRSQDPRLSAPAAPRHARPPRRAMRGARASVAGSSPAPRAAAKLGLSPGEPIACSRAAPPPARSPGGRSARCACRPRSARYPTG